MLNKDRWEEILEALVANWFRALLTAFGVFWGIFILVILLAAGKGLENGVKMGFGNIATNTVFVWPQRTSRSYKGLSKGRDYRFKIGDLAEIKSKVPGLKFISPRNEFRGYGGSSNVVQGLRAGAFNIYGDYPEIIKQDPVSITSGRFFNYGDMNANRKVAVIGEGVRRELFYNGENPIGAYIKIYGVNFMVIGTYFKENAQGNSDQSQKGIFVPFTAFSKSFNNGDNVGWYTITGNDGSSITELKKSIIDVFKANHLIHPQDDRAIGDFDLYEEYKKVSGLFLALRGVAYFVGILVLLSGIIGISNIMLIVVKERTKEIGVRRAIGATPWAIRSQILLEAIVLTIISGMVGIIASIGVIYFVNTMLDNAPAGAGVMFVNPNVDLFVVLVALFTLITSGLLAGLLPAQAAIRTRPIDALRAE